MNAVAWVIAAGAFAAYADTAAPWLIAAFLASWIYLAYRSDRKGRR